MYVLRLSSDGRGYMRLRSIFKGDDILKTFVVSDMHFDHANIIKLANRPFSNVEEMNDKIIENWNSVVGSKDIVYILGDITMGKSVATVFEFLARLNGNKTIVKGNHDKNTISDISYIERKINNVNFVMFHYPIEDWNGKYKGSIHLHGHSHSNVKSNMKNRYNVCLEANDYKPVGISDIIAFFDKGDKNEEKT